MTYSNEEIFEAIAKMIVELFEVPREDIKMDSLLFDDLDLDSIDAIDLVVRLQSYVGKRIKPEEFKGVRTIGDIVEAAQKVLANSELNGDADSNI